MQAQIAATLRFLKQAAARRADASLALGNADATASANIGGLQRGLLAEIRRLEQLKLPGS
jgi:hypothetical protein